MKYYILIITFISVLFSSCDIKEKYENEKSPVVDLAGEWWVTYSVDGVDEGAGITPLLTHNTSTDDGALMWVDDEGNFWQYRAKAFVDPANLSFGSSDTLDNDYYESRMIIQNGKVMKKVSLQPSGALADSIYFEVRFSDDGYYDTLDNWIDAPYGFVHQVSGFRRTGFLEDEH